MIFDPDMTSVKPYFVEALHEWITDNGLTPLVVVDANYQGIRVPETAIEDDKITLNVSYDAADNIQMDDELLTFNARFSGVSHTIVIPMEAVSAIYARENGKGMMFEVDHTESETSDNSVSMTKPEAKIKSEKPKQLKKSHLKLVD